MIWLGVEHERRRSSCSIFLGFLGLSFVLFILVEEGKIGCCCGKEGTVFPIGCLNVALFVALLMKTAISFAGFGCRWRDSFVLSSGRGQEGIVVLRSCHRGVDRRCGRVQAAETGSGGCSWRCLSRMRLLLLESVAIAEPEGFDAAVLVPRSDAIVERSAE